ncbi:MAG: serine/threonine protein kinase [Archangium sp.]|nr:serine/threonine protein kinase [Archangium sp.]
MKPSAAAGNDDLVGTRVGDFDVTERVAESRTGLVYRGVHSGIGRKGTIKVLRATPWNNDDTAAQFLGVVKTVNALTHRHIADVVGLGQLYDGRPFVVTEMLDGEPLEERLLRDPLDVETAVRWLLEVLTAVHAAHSAGVVHGDLKPSNIFLAKQADGSSTVKLLDFGLSSWLHDTAGRADHRSLAGGMGYVAPEQAASGTPEVSSDIYAIGVIAYELLTGALPFSGKGPSDQSADADVPQPGQLRNDLPPFLNALVVSMLHRDPRARPQTAELVRLRLTAWASKSFTEPTESRSAAGSRVSSPSIRQVKPKSNAWLPWVGVAMIACAAAGGGVWWARRKALQASPVVVVPPVAVEAISAAPEPEPPPSAAVEPGPTVAVPPAAPASEAEELEELAPLAPGGKPVTRPKRARKTAAGVLARLVSLESELRQRTPADEDVDATALALIRRYRLVLATEPPPAKVAEVDANTSVLEKTFIAPLRDKN